MLNVVKNSSALKKINVDANLRTCVITKQSLESECSLTKGFQIDRRTNELHF